ncbi:lipid A deacylase LpxR family protein [Vibrio renipiscarius]|uniref:Exonuclease n=1 Tax=Vibrio renipiscarius TaxID=1461322 RepID=A0A0C2P2X1_9VIBR|nr:lipid A deacylase LpxR family protein [Vibrio renipiscarius]KII79585.1 exonuclease [Vibrio renipiscarius]KII80787.1 exonuclease [Vibrio renipiscarius]
MKALRYLPLSSLLAVLVFSPVYAASDRATLSFAIDNDGIFGVDQDYTNGLFLSYTSASVQPNALTAPFSLSYWGISSLDKYEITLGHKMYTPTDIEAAEPLPNNRPYAGFLHSEFNYISLHSQQAQRVNLTIGTTGENSLADKAQDLVHGITGSDDPQGWHYQVDNQFIVNIGYLAHFNWYRQPTGRDHEFEISNISEVNAGNFRSDISTGVMFRWGTDLGANMGAANIDNENPFRPGMIGSSNSGWFLYGGIEARYRFNDITIEGDRSGLPEPNIYDVALKHNQATAVIGVSWYNNAYGLSLATAVKTADYEEAPDDIYGTGSLTLFTFF